jgi:hypothetical protein
MHALPEFSVTRRRASDAAVVVPVGEIDLATVGDVQAEVDAGWAVLGGCLVGRDPADRRCRSCGTRFRADGQPVGDAEDGR